jgi:hypothetical protein
VAASGGALAATLNLEPAYHEFGFGPADPGDDLPEMEAPEDDPPELEEDLDDHNDEPGKCTILQLRAIICSILEIPSQLLFNIMCNVGQMLCNVGQML